MAIHIALFTDDDRSWVRAKETYALRDAALSDAELETFRIAVEREVVATKARNAPEWWQEMTGIRLDVIKREIAYRRKVASLGGPNYAPGDWWAQAVEKIREQARRDLVAIMVEGGLIVEPRKGREDDVWGRCPIHQERTASFHVDREQGVWHCFGCGVGGDIFTWLERAHSMQFQDAVRWLAQRYGVDLTPPVESYRVWTDGSGA